MLTQTYLQRLERVEPYLELWRDDKKFVELRAGLYVTLCFMHVHPAVDANESTREALIDCWNDYWQLVGPQHQRWTYRFGSGIRGFKVPTEKVPSIDVLLRDPDNFGDYQYYVHGGTKEDDASDYLFDLAAFPAHDAPDHPRRLGFLRLQAPFSYLREGMGTAFASLARRCAERLNVDQGHGGLGFLRTYNDESTTRRAEYQLSQVFSGVDIDVPSVQMSDLYHPVRGHLGIDSPHWLNFLSDHWIEKLGGIEALRAQLPSDHFVVERYKGGLFIQAGACPEPGHQADGLPPNYVWLNRVLKPIRATTAAYCYGNEPGQLGVHQGALEYFTRFDKASDDLPPRPAPDGLGEARQPPAFAVVRLRCAAGQPCPREGWGFTPARLDSRRYFVKGDVMPNVGSDYGATVWQWDEFQTAP